MFNIYYFKNNILCKFYDFEQKITNSQAFLNEFLNVEPKSEPKF